MGADGVLYRRGKWEEEADGRVRQMGGRDRWDGEADGREREMGG